MDNKLAKIIVGVDVSKDHLDIYIIPVNKHIRIKNSDTGFKKLLKELSSYEVQCIAFESTGGYEAPMARLLEQSGYQTWLIDPVRIKAFIKSEGIKAKTDIIDAKMIAMFVAQKERKYTPKPLPAEHFELRALVKRRESLTDMISMEKKRLKMPTQTEYCKELINDLVQSLEKQKDIVEKTINSFIARNDDWKRKSLIIQSIPGVGSVTASALISHMPELGTIENKPIAALLGVAPYTRQSGNYLGNASIYGGRPTPRWPLYMAALAATRFNPVFKEFYQRLINAGKAFKVALVATMRKLICTINVMLKNNAHWRFA